jgi:tRNA nucleotidyltransferase (CCA-adding enzyme)
VFLREAGRIAHEQLGASAVAAGGIVRDALLGRPINDVDLMVIGCEARDLAALLHARFGDPARPVLLHDAFHTAVVTLARGGHKIDIATARSESYPEPAALPVVEVSCLRTDLGRRDFSINALAMHLSPATFGRLEDHFNSQSDIKAKRISVLHPLSFVDDPTRIFRGLRFAARYDFHLCPFTQRLAVQAVAHKLPHRLSGSRVFHELQKILEEEAHLPAMVLKNCQRLGLLDSLHPALQVSVLCIFCKKIVNYKL